jgi:hypothetical protein
LYALVKMAIIGGFSAVPKPDVFSLSTTTLPEKMSCWSSVGIASGCSFQCIRSVEVAWPHDMLPHVLPDGLCW